LRARRRASAHTREQRRHLRRAEPSGGPIGAETPDRRQGYDANSLRRTLEAQKTEAVIPSTTSRKRPIPYDRRAYRERNRIERAFCSLKDFRRVATRYDKLARNFLAAVEIAAVILWWT
jgi:putative transposase